MPRLNSFYNREIKNSTRGSEANPPPPLFLFFPLFVSLTHRCSPNRPKGDSFMTDEIDLGSVKYCKEASFMTMEENVGVIRINRPEALNSFNREVFAGLEEAFNALDNDPGVKVIIITGEGEKAFCTGEDVKIFREAFDDGFPPSQGKCT